MTSTRFSALSEAILSALSGSAVKPFLESSKGLQPGGGSTPIATPATACASVSNLVSLCRTHHRLVHEGGVSVEARESGGYRFRRADGCEFQILRREPRPNHHWTDLQRTHEAGGLHIDDDTAATRWRGERMDYELGVWALCVQVNRAGDANSTGRGWSSSWLRHADAPWFAPYDGN